MKPNAKSLMILLAAAVAVWPTARWLLADCQTVSGGAETDAATGSLQNVGQPAIGRTTDGVTYLHAGIIPCLATGLCIQVAPDLDNDCDVDADDFDLLADCSSGPGVPHPVSATCTQADFDGDGDVDAADYGTFQVCFSGSGNAPDAHCAD
ncbi:MAG: hypothetical protein HY718_02310 [Planctomycetes bacterium]|nr:hypothetical protein [Planctomycetota bacterium]